MRRLLLLTIGAIGFGCLVVLNVGGYRYGVSDQAFYIPVVLQELTPNMYPHDAPLIAAQDRFFFFDDWFAGILRYSDTSIPSGFLIGYALTLLLLYGAIVAVGRSMYTSWWTVSALAIGLTIRHQIPDTAVNTLESYFHPRLLAFSVGVWAVAAFLRGRTWLALVITGLALLAHPTTGLWFVVFVGSAALVSDRNARPGGGCCPRTRVCRGQLCESTASAGARSGSSDPCLPQSREAPTAGPRIPPSGTKCGVRRP